MASVIKPLVALLCLVVRAAAGNVEGIGVKPTNKIVEEEYEIGYVQSLVIDTQPIALVNSTYQTIGVYNSDHFGKVFLLDESLQLTEKDSPHYNEMLAHVPMMEYLSRKDAENIRVLVVGGGDGYVVSELLKYPNILSIDHVELDEEVINVAKKHLPWSNAWEDDRVNLVIGDGAVYVKEQAEKGRSYHIIVQDSSDPFWEEEDGSITTLPGSVLYDRSHFESFYKLLKPEEGVLVFQAETYNIPSNLDSIRKWRTLLQEIGFYKPRYGTISISTYPTGQIGKREGFFSARALDGNEKDETCNDGEETDKFTDMDASPEIDWNRVRSLFNKLNGKTKYYHPRVHRSSYDLPLWVESAIYDEI
ncbi:hypothetical protein ACHAWF_009657 [Thalassiosira exigua]